MTRFFDWFGDRFDALDVSYHNGLKWALRHRPVIIIGAILISAASFLLVPLIGTEILPQTDSGNINVLIKMPVGTALSVTDATMKRVEKVLIDNPNVDTVFSVAGSTLSLRGTSTSLTAYQGAATVRLKDVRKQSTQQVIQDVQKKLARLPGARAIVTPYDLVTQILTGGASNLEFDIYGDDLTQLAQLLESGADLRRGRYPALKARTWERRTPRRNCGGRWTGRRCCSWASRSTTLPRTLNGATNGTLSSYYQENGFQYPIYVQVPEAQRKSVDELLSLPVTPSARPANSTETSAIELRQVAQPIYAVGPNEITRQNNQRYISISGLGHGTPAKRSADRNDEPAEQNRVPDWHVLGSGRQSAAAGAGVLRFGRFCPAGDCPDLHASGRAVRVVRVSADDSDVGSPVRHRRRAGPVPDRASVRADGLHRPAAPDRHRGQERHPARGLHQPAARARSGTR